MQAINYDGQDERVALVALCLSDEVLGRVATALPEEPFVSTHSNIVVGWCVQYWSQYGKAPGPMGLTAMHADWAISASPGNAELVGKLLSSLPPSLEMSTDYAVDLIAKLVKRVKLKRTAERMLGALSNNRVDEAESLVSDYRRPELNASTDSTFVFDSEGIVDEVLTRTANASLIRFGGALEPLGQFLGPTLCRDAFVAIQARSKAGKSTHLAALLLRGAIQGRRVALFNLGDLSKSQYMKRIYTSLVGWPQFPGPFNAPKTLAYEGKEPKITFDQMHAGSGYTKDHILKAIEKHKGSDAMRLRLECHPAGRLNILQLANILKRWADEGWVPDIIGIDYADILAPYPGAKDTKEATNLAWREMRAISTEYNALLMTATQSDAQSYTTWTQGMENFSNAREKNDHPTAILGVNVTELEKTMQVARFNWVVLREREYLNQYKNSGIVAVAGNYACGRPHTLATWI